MSTNVQTSILTSINRSVTENTVAIMQGIIQANEQVQNFEQKVHVAIDGKLSCATLTITNEAKGSMRCMSAMSADQQSTLLAETQKDLLATSKSVAEQANKDLGFGQTNISTTVETIFQEAITKNSNTMQQSLQQTGIQQGNITQDIYFTVGEKGEVFISGSFFYLFFFENCMFNFIFLGDCTFTNNASLEYTASQMIDAQQQAFTETEEYTKLVSSIVSFFALVLLDFFA